jgi:hypothetical protein
MLNRSFKKKVNLVSSSSLRIVGYVNRKIKPRRECGGGRVAYSPPKVFSSLLSSSSNNAISNGFS